jgi:hypothetical protein
MGERTKGQGSGLRVIQGILALILAFPAALAPGIASAASPGPPGRSDWWSATQARISAAEYGIAPVGGDATWSAPCRAQSLRATWAHGVFSLRPRAGMRTWGLDLRTVGITRPGVPVPVAPLPTTSASGTTLTFDHGWGCETYDNRPEGLEQTFIVSEAPPGLGPLIVVLELSGAVASLSPNGQEAVLRHGAFDVVRVSQLVVRDAAGARLAARFSTEGSQLRIDVEDAGATYPITIDPLFSSPSAEHSSGVTGAAFGASVAAAGDVNGDGFADVLVGSPQHDGGQAAEGKAYLYFGSGTGPSVDPDWVYESNQARALLGFRVASAGDVNADGFADVLVSAPHHDGGGTNAGRVLLFLGSASGLSDTPAWTLDGTQAHSWLGRSIACAGDVNGDGYSDVLVGAPRHQADSAHLGRVLVFEGSSSGLSSSPSLTMDGDRYAYLGTEVAWAGDVNADGYDDVILGAGLRMTSTDGDDSESKTFVHHGSSTGLSATPSWTVTEIQSEEIFGATVTGLGDVNGDGYADVAVGAPWWDDTSASLDEAGAIRVYLGSSGGLGTTATTTLTGTAIGEAFGSTLAWPAT